MQFLSLDVEGAETLVLANANPSDFDVIMVELTGHSEDDATRIEDLIVRDGTMRRARELWVPYSRIYVGQHVRELPVRNEHVHIFRRGQPPHRFNRTLQ